MVENRATCLFVPPGSLAKGSAGVVSGSTKVRRSAESLDPNGGDLSHNLSSARYLYTYQLRSLGA